MEDAQAVCAIRKSLSFRAAIVLSDTGSTQSRDANQPEQQHRRPWWRRFYQAMEPAEPHERCEHLSYSTLSRNAGSDLRYRSAVLLPDHMAVGEELVRPDHSCTYLLVCAESECKADNLFEAKIFILSDSNMTSTLAKYVDMDNIPKKYGGTLDWQFGDLPFLEPAIANSLNWKENIEQKGHKTLPLGPIKWQYDNDNRDLVAIAIGSENDKPRNRVIGALHPQTGVARLALSPGRADNQALFRATPAQIPAVQDRKPATASMAASSNASSKAETTPATSVQDTSTTGASTGSVQTGAPRGGTSVTRYEQQHGTHAEGQMANGTPATTLDGRGEQQAIMEPNTVGQAPKEHPMKIPEQAQQTTIDQAKEMATHALEQAKQVPTVVMSAVGMGGAKQEEHNVAEAKKEDPAVNSMPVQNVEEFLRAQSMTKPASSVPKV